MGFGHRKKTLAKGAIKNFDVEVWHELKLTVRGKEIEAFVDGESVAKVTSAGNNKGYVALASSYDENLFDNLKVSP